MKGKRDQKSGKVKNLRGKKLDDKQAGRVKGGFNPQPDPPKVLSGIQRAKLYDTSSSVIVG